MGSGDFKRIMVSLASAGRGTKPVDEDLAKEDAKDLYDAGQGQWGTDEGTFNRIFAGRSFPHLRAVIKFYKKKTGEGRGYRQRNGWGPEGCFSNAGQIYSGSYYLL